MTYLNARYVSEIVRFISPDTIVPMENGISNGLNRYFYCNNNKVMFIDPSGHTTVLSILDCKITFIEPTGNEITNIADLATLSKYLVNLDDSFFKTFKKYKKITSFITFTDNSIPNNSIIYEDQCEMKYKRFMNSSQKKFAPNVLSLKKKQQNSKYDIVNFFLTPMKIQKDLTQLFIYYTQLISVLSWQRTSCSHTRPWVNYPQIGNTKVRRNRKFYLQKHSQFNNFLVYLWELWFC